MPLGRAAASRALAASPPGVTRRSSSCWAAATCRCAPRRCTMAIASWKIWPMACWVGCARKGFATIDDFRGLSLPNVKEWKHLNLNYPRRGAHRRRASALAASSATPPAGMARTSASTWIARPAAWSSLCLVQTLATHTPSPTRTACRRLRWSSHSPAG